MCQRRWLVEIYNINILSYSFNPIFYNKISPPNVEEKSIHVYIDLPLQIYLHIPIIVSKQQNRSYILFNWICLRWILKLTATTFTGICLHRLSCDKPFWQLYSVSPAIVWTFFPFPPLLPGWSALRREPEWKKGVIEFHVIKMRSGRQRQQRIMVACPWACWARDGWPQCTVYLWMLMFSVGEIAIVFSFSSQGLCRIMGSFYVMMWTSLKGLPQQCCSYVTWN